ncbi:unnamed protein product [Paramecium sonneborni]|uniref:Uncharacterized protein n=1 Tax=Paramecium sonneborni TaxID=65129 RepID=A0A8S1RQP9_9CILI|nr:unnamed protein product [Paramecium sonneborni]
MNFQKFFTCQDISHEKDNIQGFCLNFGCISSRSQFCLQCAADPMKHTNCRKDLKGFGQIQLLMIKFQEYLLNLTTQLNKSFEQCKTKYEEYSKQMEKMRINLNQKFAEIKIKNEEYTIQMEKMNTQLVKLSECLIQQDYQYIKQNLQSVKEWYQYFYNQEEIIKQNQIGTSFYIQYDFLIIFTIKRIIKALNQNRYQQSSQIKRLEQEQENILQEGLIFDQQQFRNTIKINNKKTKIYTKSVEMVIGL